MRRDQRTTPATIAAYRRSLDRVFDRSLELLPAAPTWQSGLFLSVRTCYTEMRAHPEALHLHFVATTSDPGVRRVRVAHRDRLLALLAESRRDAPPPLHAELMLSMIHATLSAEIARHGEAPDLDGAERTFASLLFHYEAPQAA
jgi:hypothetical protein